MSLLNKMKLLIKDYNLKYKTKSSYFLNCRKNTETQEFQTLIMARQ